MRECIFQIAKGVKMKRNFLMLILVSLVIFSLITFVPIGTVYEEGEYYIYQNNTYQSVLGKYKKSKCVAKTHEGRKLYAVQNDKHHAFLVDSFGGLFLNNNYEPIDTAITGVFLDNYYTSNSDFLDFIIKLSHEIDTSKNSVLENNSDYCCKVYNTPNSASVFLCYDKIKCGSDYFGYIAWENGVYYYADMKKGNKIDSEHYHGIKIKSEYYTLLDKHL